MIPVRYSARALLDLERLALFQGPDRLRAAEVVELVLEAVEVLSHHPYLGRPVRRSLRELVISYGRTGYVALYRLQRGQVQVLGLRHQREAGYR